jgi:hypothetical protein
VNTAEILLKVKGEHVKQELDGAAKVVDGFREDQKEKSVSSANSVMKSLATVFAAKITYDTFSGFVSSAQEAQEALAVLESSVKSNGGAVGWTTSQIAGLSDEMEKNTKFSAESTQEAASMMLAFKNVQGEEFGRGLKVAADMATRHKTSIAGAGEEIARYLDRPSESFEKLAKQGVVLSKSQQETIESLEKSGQVAEAQAIILTALEESYGGAAEAAGAASFEPFLNQIGNIGEEIGAKLIPVIQSITPILGDFADYLVGSVLPSLGGFFDGMVSFAQTGVEWTLVAMDYLVAGVAYSVDFTVFLWNNAMSILDLAAKSFVLGVVGSFGVVEHLLTVALPEWLLWLADNWSSILTDMANFSATVFSNMTDNVSEFFSGITRLLSGGSADFRFTALTEGFEATLRELPEIAKRVPGEIEKSLALDVGNLTTTLNTATPKFGDYLPADRVSPLSVAKTTKSDPKWGSGVYAESGKKEDKTSASIDSDNTAVADRIQAALLKRGEDDKATKATDDNTAATEDLTVHLADTSHQEAVKVNSEMTRQLTVSIRDMQESQVDTMQSIVSGIADTLLRVESSLVRTEANTGNTAAAVSGLYRLVEGRRGGLA